MCVVCLTSSRLKNLARPVSTAAAAAAGNSDSDGGDNDDDDDGGGGGGRKYGICCSRWEERGGRGRSIKSRNIKEKQCKSRPRFLYL